MAKPTHLLQMKKTHTLRLSLGEVTFPYLLFQIVYPFKYKIKYLFFFSKLRYSLKWKLCLLVTNLLSTTVKGMLLHATRWKHRRQPCSMWPFLPLLFSPNPRFDILSTPETHRPMGKKTYFHQDVISCFSVMEAVIR